MPRSPKPEPPNALIESVKRFPKTTLRVHPELKKLLQEEAKKRGINQTDIFDEMLCDRYGRPDILESIRDLKARNKKYTRRKE